MNKEELQLKRILCPIVLSDLSLSALDYAVLLAKQFKAKIYIIHVIPLSRIKDNYVDYGYGGVCIDNLAEKDETNLKDICYKRIPSDIDYECKMFREDLPARAISYFAYREKVDLIVMSNNMKNDLKEATLGDTTEKIMRMSRCPVMIIRNYNLAEKANNIRVCTG